MRFRCSHILFPSPPLPSSPLRHAGTDNSLHCIRLRRHRRPPSVAGQVVVLNMYDLTVSLPAHRAPQRHETRRTNAAQHLMAARHQHRIPPRLACPSPTHAPYPKISACAHTRHARWCIKGGGRVRGGGGGTHNRQCRQNSSRRRLRPLPPPPPPAPRLRQVVCRRRCPAAAVSHAAGSHRSHAAGSHTAAGGPRGGAAPTLRGGVAPTRHAVAGCRGALAVGASPQTRDAGAVADVAFGSGAYREAGLGVRGKGVGVRG
jgi:hypothetical protein